MLLTAISIAGSFKNLHDMITEPKRHTVFDFDLSNPDSSTYKHHLLSVINSCAMSKNSELVITEKMKAIFDRPPFDSLWDSKEERENLIDCFHKQLRIHNTNQLEMGEHTFENLPDQKFWYSKTIGSGLCPFSSLFNHSCDSNVKRFTVDNKIAFVVGRPIKAGEQLFISYGYSSYRMSRDERRKQLQRFSFNCDCQACVKNFPQIVQLVKIDKRFVEPKFDEVTRTFEGVEIFKKNCEYIEKNIVHHPCMETTTLMIHNEHLLHQISRMKIE